MVSVVIPAYNAAAFIRRTIDSVLRQSYRDFELIVVDDGSTDSTARVVKGYGQALRYIYQENAGDGPARNTGIEAAKGQWIAFLDHDDEWLPEKLERQMALLKRNPQLRWCAANYFRAGAGRRSPVGNTAALERQLAGREYFDDYFTAVGRKGCTLITLTLVIHKTVFERVGLFDSCWLLCADLDMWWRIAYEFPQIGYVPQPLGVMHLGELDVVATKRHLAGKRGDDARRLIAKHLGLAAEHGRTPQFIPVARRILKQSLAATIYHGFKTDARTTAKQFRQILGRRWLALTYLSTVFPGLTTSLLRSAAALARILNLDRQVTRRWIYEGSDGNSYD